MPVAGRLAMAMVILFSCACDGSEAVYCTALWEDAAETLLKICANIMAPDLDSGRIQGHESGPIRVGYIPQSIRSRSSLAHAT